VELAQLNYMLPRLTGKGAEMSRLGGGIGTRGPGENQIGTDRRRIHGDSGDPARSGAGARRAIHAAPAAASGSARTLALVGYTNAGKSTLLTG